LNFHKQAPAAHAASIAAHKQGKFYEFRNELAPHYKELNEAKFIEVAKKVGLNITQFKTDMKLSAETSAIIEADKNLGGTVGVRGTPSFYINGKKYNGAMSIAAIDRALSSL